jgi:hypothetical protein
VTRLQAQTILYAVQLFHASRRRLPPDLEALTRTDPALGAPWMARIPVDAWGRAFRYVVRGGDLFEVRSLGPDGEEGTADDVVAVPSK